MNVGNPPRTQCKRACNDAEDTMEFDPYYEWLDIPPDRRPPGPYDLLGLPEGESDADAIREAATERYEHVRKYTLPGSHVEDATRILNEISQALNTLIARVQHDEETHGLDEATRSDGDVPVAEPADQLVSPPPLPAVENAPPQDAAWSEATAIPPEGRWKAARPATPRWVLFGLATAGGLLLVVLIALVASRPGRPPDDTALSHRSDIFAESPTDETPVIDPELSVSDLPEQTEDAGDSGGRPAESLANESVPPPIDALDEDIEQAGPMQPEESADPQDPDEQPADDEAADSEPPGLPPTVAKIVTFRRTLSGAGSPVTSPAFPSGAQQPGVPGSGSMPSFFGGASAPSPFSLPGSSSRVPSGRPAITFSPDGSLLLAVQADSLEVWEARRWTVRAKSARVSGPVQSMAVSPDGSLLATSSPDRMVRIWDLPGGQLRQQLVGYELGVSAVAFGPGGASLILGCREQGGTLELFDFQAGRFFRTIESQPEQVKLLARSGDGSMIAAAGGNSVWLWDAATAKPLGPLPGLIYNVTAIAFSPDGTKLAVAGDRRGIELWDVRSRRQAETLAGLGGPARCLTFAPGGSILASAGAGRIRFWDVRDGTLLQTVTEPDTSGVLGLISGLDFHGHSLTFSPDGSTFALAGENAAIHLWDVVAGEDFVSRAGPTPLKRSTAADLRRVSGLAAAPLGRGRQLASGPVASLAFHPQEQTVATAEGNSVKLWDVGEGRLLGTFEGHGATVRYVTFDATGRLLASASDDRTVKIWDTKSGRLQHTLAGFSSMPTCAAFDPEGPTIVTGSFDRILRLWSVTSGDAGRKFIGAPGLVRCVAFSSNGSILASGSESPNVQLWTVSQLRQRRWLDGHRGGVNSVAFQPEGTGIASASDDGTVRLWERLKGDLLATLQGHIGTVASVAFSPDGKLLASGGTDRTVKIWDAAAGRLLGDLPGHPAGVTSVAFNPDGLVVAAGAGMPLSYASLQALSSRRSRAPAIPTTIPFAGTTDTPGGLILWDVSSLAEEVQR